MNLNVIYREYVACCVGTKNWENVSKVKSHFIPIMDLCEYVLWI